MIIFFFRRWRWAWRRLLQRSSPPRTFTYPQFIEFTSSQVFIVALHLELCAVCGNMCIHGIFCILFFLHPKSYVIESFAIIVGKSCCPFSTPILCIAQKGCHTFFMHKAPNWFLVFLHNFSFFIDSSFIKVWLCLLLFRQKGNTKISGLTCPGRCWQNI